MRALASAFGRSSAVDGMAALMVNGMSASFCDKVPNDTYAFASLLCVSFTRPEIEPEFRLLSGQRSMRPCDGPAVGEFVPRSGLSHTNEVTLLWKNDPS